MSRRQRRTYSKEFKQQVVDLYLAGKPRAEIIRDEETRCQGQSEQSYQEFKTPYNFCQKKCCHST